MALMKLQFRPGINRDQTNYTNEGGWYDCDKIRFRSGYPEKIGGWQVATPTRFFGVCRQMWGWVTSFRDNLLALGTNKKVYVEAGGNYFDITPIRATFTSPGTDNCISVTSGSTTVVFDVTGHGATTGSFVNISGVAGPIGGIPASDINGNREITVISANSFSIDVATAATSTATNQGGTSITLAFEIEVSFAITTEGYGWGTSDWGREAWGSGSDAPIFLQQRDWWFDNFDNDLVMNIRNGPIYYWVRGALADPNTAFTTRAVALADMVGASDVPDLAMQTMVSQNDKHLLAFGCTPFGGGPADPLLIRWASQDNPLDWTPTPLNSSGFLRVSRGSQIIRALPTRQETLIWTDTHLYTLQFLGTLDVFGLQEYADNISIISPRAVISANNVTYWMGQDKFYAYTGRVETLPCTIRNYVFQNINTNQTDQIICGTNEEWNEIWWFYPTVDSNWNNRYVVYNYLEQIWYYGNMERTAWLDTPLRRYPQAACSCNQDDSTGRLFNHEDGVDANGEPMESFIESSDFDLNDGDQFMLTRRIIPDVNFQGSTAATPEVKLQIRTRNFPGGVATANATDTKPVIEAQVGRYTDQVFIRARARQMALKLSSENLGVQWQIGSPRLDGREDGRR